MNNVFTAIQNRDGETMANLTGSDRQYAGSDNVVNITAERLVDAMFKQLKQLFPAAEQTNLKTPAQETAAKQQWIAAFAEGGVRTREQVSAGMRHARASESPFWPSPGQFIKWCKDSKMVLGISIEDVMGEFHRYAKEKSLQPGGPERFPWRHPVMYWIVCDTRRAMYQRQLSEAEVEKHARKLLDEWSAKVASGHQIPDPILSIQAKPEPMSTPPTGSGNAYHPPGRSFGCMPTANTDNQLRTKTWPEIIKWSNLAITKEWFTCTATAMYSNDPGHDKRWRADAIPWSEHNTEAFAGLHNERKRIIVVFDEASNIADLVWEVAEGALTDEDTEIIWVAFGNPTRNTGRFRECFRKYKHRWKCAQIDSRTVEGTNKQQLQKWVDDYGEDSDFVKVRVRGIFPDASELQFIPTGLTDEAMKRVVTAGQVAHAPVIIGVDPAYSGVDEADIYLRQGLHSKLLWSGLKTTDDLIMAKRIADFEDQYQADAVFIDFGYGTGLKSIGDGWGRSWQLIPFGGGSTDPQMLNKRGEMFNSCKTWLKLGGALDDQETADDLSAAEYKVRVDGKIVIEPKEDIKERLGRSPGKGDALLLTFAFPVSKRMNIPGQQSQQGKALTEYDPYA